MKNNSNLDNTSNIQPLMKSKKNKIYISVGIIFIAFATVAIAATRLKNKDNQKEDTNSKQDNSKIENITPAKVFNKPPEQINIETNNSSTNPQNINIIDTNITSATTATTEYYNSSVCDNCGNENKNNQDNALKISVQQDNDLQNYGNSNNKNDHFSELEPAKIKISKASYLKNQNTLIAKGAFLDAVLETKIDSSLKGMVSAILDSNIYSVNGAVLLLEKGSKITGQYNSQIKEGAERLMVIWDRLRTPSGIIIDLNSFGTDSLGGSGLSGKINHQYAKRFGSAILLSIIDDSLSSLSNNQNNITNNIQNTQQQGRNIAEQALSNSINIAPILYKNQGEHINIFVAHDLDFSDVYKLKMKTN